ncbi:hypothetical protein BS47DRAFT_1417015 [Hydnum rufescens UP504]|uniref:Uncharacterized protein n=1 Tax=Hydnum rufescens UP504 TaxID=1448309 RepID=A0A9P6DMR8_9AGAM|nr:hypothetical protein BS47DRAFT_1417015 [Hydnum rufescens UP504]
MQQDCHAVLIAYLNITMVPQKGETTVDNFAIKLFKVLGYVGQGRVAHTQVDLLLHICSENRHTKTNVCIVDCSQNDILLLVQEDKRFDAKQPVNAWAQLVAEAVAAFNENNAQWEVAGLPPLVEKHCYGRHLPCILQNPHHSNSVNSYLPWNLP